MEIFNSGSDNKVALAAKIREQIMNPQNFERMLLTLSDEEMDLFELIAFSPGVTLKSEEIYFEHDVLYSLVFTNTAKHSFVPSEVVKLYNEINRSELQNKRRQAQWILAMDIPIARRIIRSCENGSKSITEKSIRIG